MSAASDPKARAGHAQRAQLSIPQFEPLPPTSFINRLINKVLAPLFYLLFTIITAIVVVPVYTIIENIKQGRNSKGGQRRPRNYEREEREPDARNKATEFLKGTLKYYDEVKVK
ncbi:hypothetical protein H2198_008381 [Neophaeococcomyces mojaviensis]|uniref:Uncharacterized protein n=1 Tax=Neophaeococcomyces mojaviensis TaxID=3383035 RepID=A0ACC2ZY18_9EURO|nr:hypothetical protein H2198_008381 [Knufia sp. JES_112]